MIARGPSRTRHPGAPSPRPPKERERVRRMMRHDDRSARHAARQGRARSGTGARRAARPPPGPERGRAKPVADLDAAMIPHAAARDRRLTHAHAPGPARLSPRNRSRASPDDRTPSTIGDCPASSIVTSPRSRRPVPGRSRQGWASVHATRGCRHIDDVPGARPHVLGEPRIDRFVRPSATSPATIATSTRGPSGGSRARVDVKIGEDPDPHHASSALKAGLPCAWASIRS